MEKSNGQAQATGSVPNFHFLQIGVVYIWFYFILEYT